MKLNFIGIGAEKSATTWVWKCLSEHPQVVMSSPKELNFFSDNFTLGEQWYLSHFSKTEGKLYYGEISPLYMDSSKVPLRIRSLYPDVILFAILRNPFERSISHLLMDSIKVFDNPANVNLQMLKQLAESDPKYIRRSCYYSQLSPFYDVFPREQIRIWFYEDMLNSPGEFARRVFSDLGLNNDYLPSCVDSKTNAYAKFRSRKLYLFFRVISSCLKDSHFGQSLIDWLRKKGIWDRMIQLICQKADRPQFVFYELFDLESEMLLNKEMDKLKDLIGGELPDSWRKSARNLAKDKV